ncbi:hypothetical protein [Dethiothermospora halolimnae]|uniref:hypothetical protein n=1 Tax=Dethiothermospora halolimnae TaxID=3114390 RepID=UPI003CCBDB83
MNNKIINQINNLDKLKQEITDGDYGKLKAYKIKRQRLDNLLQGQYSKLSKDKQKQISLIMVEEAYRIINMLEKQGKEEK